MNLFSHHTIFTSKYKLRLTRLFVFFRKRSPSDVQMPITFPRRNCLKDWQVNFYQDLPSSNTNPICPWQLHIRWIQPVIHNGLALGPLNENVYLGGGGEGCFFALFLVFCLFLSIFMIYLKCSFIMIWESCCYFHSIRKWFIEWVRLVA